MYVCFHNLQNLISIIKSIWTDWFQEAFCHSLVENDSVVMYMTY